MVDYELELVQYVGGRYIGRGSIIYMANEEWWAVGSDKGWGLYDI